MPLLNKERFLQEVISQIKFRYDRDTIKKELEAHISDKTEYYLEQGYNRNEAEELSVNDMGDAKIIGKELNKQHNPLLGWIWSISNVLLFISILMSLYFLGAPLMHALFSGNPLKDFPESEIVYKIDIDERVQIDDRVIHFTNVIYDKNGDMNIFYKIYNKKPWKGGWNSGYIGEVGDNLGNTYFTGSGYSSEGIITRGRKNVNDFSKEADTLIINYDLYNRSFRVEIPLKAGEV